jgi:hypothetical protein
MATSRKFLCNPDLQFSGSNLTLDLATGMETNLGSTTLTPPWNNFGMHPRLGNPPGVPETNEA